MNIEILRKGYTTNAKKKKDKKHFHQKQNRNIKIENLFCFLMTVLRRSSRCSLTLWCFVVYSARRFVICLTLCHFVLVFFSPFSIAITSLGEERANLIAFRMFDRFVLVWIWRFPLPLDVWERLRFVIVALPGNFSYLFLML